MRIAALVAFTTIACGSIGVAAQDMKPATKKAAPAAGGGDAAIIKSATAGAPASIGKDATIVTIGADMKMRTVRKGTNGFTCMVGGPGPDPMCADENAMAWFDAYMNKKEPPKDRVGFVYMLSGDHGASNTDPYAEKPSPANHWVKTGPHVMIVGAKGMTAAYPRAADADPTKAYVMWAGTPYEHLMLPVR